jgi:uncharacterized protein
MKYVMCYENAADFAEKAKLHFTAHRARLDEFHAAGTLLMAGPLLDQRGGAIGIFTSREAAEEFIKDDPFVLNGVVMSWEIREWMEILAP